MEDRVFVGRRKLWDRKTNNDRRVDNFEGVVEAKLWRGCIEIRFGNLEKKAEEVSRVDGNVFSPSVPRDCVARVEASRFEVNKTKFKVCSKLSRMYNARCPPPPPPCPRVYRAAPPSIFVSIAKSDLTLTHFTRQV